VDLRLWLGYPVSFSADQTVRGGRDIGGGVFVLGYDGFPADFEPGDETRWPNLPRSMGLSPSST
jgi:hypothetical protein